MKNVDSTMQAATSPEWLAMAAYGLLIFVYVQGPVIDLRTVSTVLGYSLLLLSKVLKDKKKEEWEFVARAWGYVFVSLGFSFHHVRDAVAVLAYAMSLANIEGANTLLSSVLALKIRDSTTLGPILGRVALVIYSI